jgi:hypothetical protein
MTPALTGSAPRQTPRQPIERCSRRRLGALLQRVYRGKDLVYIGHTGTGFNQRPLADVREPQCA